MFALGPGRKGRLAGIVVSLPLALALAATAAAPAVAQTETIRYVALGDSYTAGQGTGVYINPCLQSPLGYPALIDALPEVQLVGNTSCFGWTADQVAAALPAAPDPSIDLVTVTVGGNDLQFSLLGTACLGPTPDPVLCEDILTVTGTEAQALRAELTALYRAIAASYPEADVVVLGYPSLFSPQAHRDPFARALLVGGDKLNQAVRQAAHDAGVTYVDVRDEFRGHEIDSADPWIGNFVPLTLESLHPSAQGYRYGYFQALVNDAIVPAQ